ncbi:hypothetical protein NDU88_006312 [Pleurodeles waltl]|uniref:Uncharacterized protein n=1 Tax=Pleurodeles waltl TaxID=8319 RepID=A0AAV7PJD6_PLEWA|nr:hypothetical protein NDU88_006312 [Pleurodeles waltl]
MFPRYKEKDFTIVFRFKPLNNLVSYRRYKIEGAHRLGRVRRPLVLFPFEPVLLSPSCIVQSLWVGWGTFLLIAAFVLGSAFVFGASERGGAPPPVCAGSALVSTLAWRPTKGAVCPPGMCGPFARQRVSLEDLREEGALSRGLQPSHRAALVPGETVGYLKCGSAPAAPLQRRVPGEAESPRMRLPLRRIGPGVLSRTASVAGSVEFLSPRR